jgi:hypothetical protein
MRAGHQIALLFVTLLSSGAVMAQSAPQADVKDRIVIPDGTGVKLRFAQLVYARHRFRVPAVQEGDAVRLVVGADVRIGGKLVIARGALAEATVVSAMELLPSQPGTGVELHLDWVEAVTGEQLRLRSTRQRHGLRFWVDVASTDRGIVARPATFTGRIKELKNPVKAACLYARVEWKINLCREIEYIPAGTRIDAFVDGAFELDSAEVDAAQSRYFSRGDRAALTIYRAGEQRREKMAIYSGENMIAELAAEEYLAVELNPGRYEIHAANKEPLLVELQAEDEAYVHVRWRKLGSRWELKIVDTLQGEDAVDMGQSVNTRVDENLFHAVPLPPKKDGASENE